MKEKLTDLLACPVCGGEIALIRDKQRENSHIMEGALGCAGCGKEYVISRGVPRFASIASVEREKAETAENFGWQWTHFTQDDPKYEEQLLGWLQPVRPEWFKDKIILEGGCGKGRHSVLAAKWGAKEVIGVDLSEAVDSAFKSTCMLPNVHIIQADLFHLPLRKAFDYAFSVGVLHHTPDPAEAFISMAAKVRRGGSLSAWVYGLENNRWIIKIINPLREGVTSKIGQPLLYQISKLPALGVFVASKMIYRPMNRVAPRLSKRLFYNDYLDNLAKFGWREQHNIVFDHLVAPTAFYISRQEFENWWTAVGAEDVEITWHNRNSWCGFGRVAL